MKLAAEKEDSGNRKVRAELLGKELQGVTQQLDNVVASLDREKLKSSKIEVKGSSWPRARPLSLTFTLWSFS